MSDRVCHCRCQECMAVHASDLPCHGVSDRDPFQIVREALETGGCSSLTCRENPNCDMWFQARAALDQAEAELEGHRENADVLAAMTATLKRVEAERDRLREALRMAHGMASAMADMDSWIAEQCGMEHDGERWYVPEARAALSPEKVYPATAVPEGGAWASENQETQ